MAPRKLAVQKNSKHDEVLEKALLNEGLFFGRGQFLPALSQYFAIRGGPFARWFRITKRLFPLNFTISGIC